MKMKENHTMDFYSTKENSYSTTFDGGLHFGLSTENARLLYIQLFWFFSCSNVVFFIFSTNHKLKCVSHPWTAINSSVRYCMNLFVFPAKQCESFIIIDFCEKFKYSLDFYPKGRIILSSSWLFFDFEQYYLLFLNLEFFLTKNKIFTVWINCFFSRIFVVMCRPLHYFFLNANFTVFGILLVQKHIM